MNNHVKSEMLSNRHTHRPSTVTLAAHARRGLINMCFTHTPHTFCMRTACISRTHHALVLHACFGLWCIHLTHLSHNSNIQYASKKCYQYHYCSVSLKSDRNGTATVCTKTLFHSSDWCVYCTNVKSKKLFQ